MAQLNTFQIALLLVVLASSFISCSTDTSNTNGVTKYSISAPSTTSFSRQINMIKSSLPSDESLNRPEDGVEFEGKLYVIDVISGLRIISKDRKSSSPFSDLASLLQPHDTVNGLSLDKTNRVILLAELEHGKIFEVDIDSGKSRLLLQHPKKYGFNSIVRRESSGELFATIMSTTKLSESFGTVTPENRANAATGKVVRIPPISTSSSNKYEYSPDDVTIIDDNMFFANGICFEDSNQNAIIVAETFGERLYKYTISSPKVEKSLRARLIGMPDNVKVDSKGNLYVAIFGLQQVVVIPKDSQIVVPLLPVVELDGFTKFDYAGAKYQNQLEYLIAIPHKFTSAYLSEDEQTIYLGNVIFEGELSGKIDAVYPNPFTLVDDSKDAHCIDDSCSI